MVRLLLILFFFSTHLNSNGQYCTSVGPSSTVDSNIESVTINGEASSINYTGCPGIAGLETYTAQTVSLQAGMSYSLAVQFGTCGGNYSGVGEVWIDFNGNQLFESQESIGTWSGTPPTSISNFTVNVPSDASSGLTKMRIIHEEGGTLPIDPCGTFSWGSATDFNVNVSGGVDCMNYVGDIPSNPRLITSYPFVETHNSSICYSNQNSVYPSPDVYYLVIPDPSMNSMEFSLCNSTFDTFITVRDEDGNILGINDDHPDCGAQSKISIYTSQHDSLYVIVEGWSNESGEYTLSIDEGSIGLNEISIAEAITAYPNPTNGTIQFNNEQKTDVHISNIKGQLIMESTILPNQIINLSSLENGVYFYQISNSGRINKLIKQ